MLTSECLCATCKGLQNPPKSSCCAHELKKEIVLSAGDQGGGGEPRADVALLFRAYPAGRLLHGAHAALWQHSVPLPHRLIHPDAQGGAPDLEHPLTSALCSMTHSLLYSHPFS